MVRFPVGLAAPLFDRSLLQPSQAIPCRFGALKPFTTLTSQPPRPSSPTFPHKTPRSTLFKAHSPRSSPLRRPYDVAFVLESGCLHHCSSGFICATVAHMNFHQPFASNISLVGKRVGKVGKRVGTSPLATRWWYLSNSWTDTTFGYCFASSISLRMLRISSIDIFSLRVCSRSSSCWAVALTLMSANLDGNRMDVSSQERAE